MEALAPDHHFGVMAAVAPVRSYARGKGATDMPVDLPGGAAWIRAWMATSPFVGHLGMRLVRLESDLAEVVMPFRDELVTLGDVVHGGAIGALIDSATTSAAWSGAEALGNPRGATVGFTVDFVAAARGRDLTASARVIRRGRSLCFCDVDVVVADARLVAKGLVTYKLGS
jgi:uncharacterized protein (TIGR00369 family)